MKTKLVLLVLLLSLLQSPVVSAGITFDDVWTYTDGIETNSTYMIIDGNNYTKSLFQDNYWTLYTQQGMYAGFYQNFTGIDTQYNIYDSLVYVNQYDIMGYNNISVDVTSITRQYNNDTYQSASIINRIDNVSFLGFGEYTFEDNSTVSTVDIMYTENVTSSIGRSVNIEGSTNTTWTFDNGNNTKYINGVKNDTFINIRSKSHIYQFAPSVWRVVSVTKIESSPLSMNADTNRRMLSYNINNYIDWSPPEDETTTSIIPIIPTTLTPTDDINIITPIIIGVGITILVIIIIIKTKEN